MRTCSHCKRLLPEISFNWKVKDVKRSYHCKDCSRQYVRKHYQKNTLYYRKKAKKSNQRYLKSAYAYLRAYLLNNPCIDCGETDILVLEFDHRERKDKFSEIGTIIRRGLSLAILKAEVAKCDVRCANCHRRKTLLETGSWRVKMPL